MAETIPIKNLKFAEYNPREISRHDFESLKRSIQEFGLRRGKFYDKRIKN